jgi:prevent-host-death family protein
LTKWLPVATFPFMNTVSIKKAKDSLTELSRRVEGGESIVVTRHGKPVFEMVPYTRKGGLDLEAGQRYLESIGVTDPVPYIADDFDDPLPEDFLLRPLP